MSETSTDRLRRLRRTASQVKAARVRAAVEAAALAGGPFSVSKIARTAGVSRRFIYDHPELRAEIELKAAQSVERLSGHLSASARVSAASLRADYQNSRAENRRLRERIHVLETRLAEVLGAEVTAELAGQGALVNEKTLRQEIERLQAKIGELTGELRHREQDLDGARRANRELMAQLNRRSPRS
jgi:chromosome segregation ATPase